MKNTVSKELKILKAYKLQLDQLGYIVSGGQIKGREAITERINAKINKSVYTPPNNTRALIYSCLCKGKGSSNMIKYLNIAKKGDFNGYTVAPHIVEFARLHRKVIKKGIDLQLKEYNVT